MKVKLEHITKVIRRRTVLDDITYTFEPGQIYGLHGINGSGKTMLLRAIAGLIHLNRGTITIDRQVLHRDVDFAPDAGILIENMTLQPQYSALENLALLAKIRHVASREQMVAALHEVGLGEQIDSPKVSEFSLGMRQKLNIAQAVFENQSLILLDEPTNGLDTASVDKVVALLHRLKAEGKLVIVASHIDADVSRMVDVSLELADGRLLV